MVIADDSAPYRRVIRAIMDEETDLDVVGEAADGEEAVALVTEHAPHVVVMDIRMPNLTGIDAARVLSEMHPNARVLMLTVSDEEEDLFEAIKAGASGYLLKDTDPGDVAEAVRRIHRSEAVLSRAVTPILMTQLAESLKGHEHRVLRPLVTHKELQILQHLAGGLSPSEAGSKLDIPENTVNHHVHNVLSKMQLHERLQALVEAVELENIDD